MNQPIDPGTGKGALYRHSLDCLVKTVRSEGFFAIYKGFFAQWLRWAAMHTHYSTVIVSYYVMMRYAARSVIDIWFMLLHICVSKFAWS
jgi:hypothetical protein